MKVSSLPRHQLQAGRRTRCFCQSSCYKVRRLPGIGALVNASMFLSDLPNTAWSRLSCRGRFSPPQGFADERRESERRNGSPS